MDRFGKQGGFKAPSGFPQFGAPGQPGSGPAVSEGGSQGIGVGAYHPQQQFMVGDHLRPGTNGPISGSSGAQWGGYQGGHSYGGGQLHDDARSLGDGSTMYPGASGSQPGGGMARRMYAQRRADSFAAHLDRLMKRRQGGGW